VQKTLEANPDLQEEAQLSSYVRTTIRRSALRKVGRRNHQAHLSLVPPLSETARRVWECPFLTILAKESAGEVAELTRLAFDHLADLPDEKRETIELAILREPPMKLREIAEIQGVSISTVHERIRTGLRYLAVAIAKGTGKGHD
jgi:RNA polymerase sigma factor (sigma-70 family)